MLCFKSYCARVHESVGCKRQLILRMSWKWSAADFSLAFLPPSEEMFSFQTTSLLGVFWSHHSIPLYLLSHPVPSPSDLRPPFSSVSTLWFLSLPPPCVSRLLCLTSNSPSCIINSPQVRVVIPTCTQRQHVWFPTDSPLLYVQTPPNAVRVCLGAITHRSIYLPVPPLIHTSFHPRGELNICLSIHLSSLLNLHASLSFSIFTIQSPTHPSVQPPFKDSPACTLDTRVKLQLHQKQLLKNTCTFSCATQFNTPTVYIGPPVRICRRSQVQTQLSSHNKWKRRVI